MYNYVPPPGNHKRVKLTRQHAFVWNIPVTDAYIDKRKRSINANINDYENDPNYAEVERDMSLVKNKKTRLVRVTALYKFDKFDKSRWFCLYDDKYIRLYRGEKVRKDIVYPMKRHLDEVYNITAIDSVFDRYDARCLCYSDYMSMARFTAEIKQLKAK